MKLGVVGLPNVGKSTLFNAITKNMVPSENYPFCTIEPNSGVVAVPDERLDVLTQLYNAKKTVPAIIEFVDIAGLVKGASKGEGLGNKFLSHIREVDAIVHVVRCFDSDNITHVSGEINPINDIEIINLELILADLETATKRLEKAKKSAKGNDKNAILEVELLEKLISLLEKEQPIRNYTANDIEKSIIKQMFFITDKPIIYCANISENQISTPPHHLPNVKKVMEYANLEKAETIVVCAKFEEELATLSEQDAIMFKQELSLTSTGLQQLIKASYDLLGLISYLTAGEKEVRAWTITKGTKAPQAAGKIHSDFERGFIKAEVIPYNTLVEVKSFVHAKEKGLVSIVGKEYIVNDGDVIIFRFNV